MSSSAYVPMPSNPPSNLATAHADDTAAGRAEPQFVRVAEMQREPLRFFLDGREVGALQGDTLLTAVLMQQRRVRDSEFSGAPRAGFCLIGACQDCWMRSEDGKRLRACSTLVTEGMRVVSRFGIAADHAATSARAEGDAA
ncbi:(2Fe-2S)-binding protein [Paraburkholderia bryophila]|uniref:(2Fe-2S)-binding protein n=1 Tax=Paraburkholderia bryophila TaxID=420952 RepID=UPI00234A14C0|nr:(2Fe-2S)-binding protein [Paraburkholderia bryophila]WCM24009.1 (2Fe-2S)-binding protein [Paraburkholderia bryophila]